MRILISICILLGNCVVDSSTMSSRPLPEFFAAAKAKELPFERFSNPRLVSSFAVSRSHMASNLGPRYWHPGYQFETEPLLRELEAIAELDPKCIFAFDLLNNRPDWLKISRTLQIRLESCLEHIVERAADGGDSSSPISRNLDMFLRAVIVLVYCPTIQGLVDDYQDYTPIERIDENLVFTPFRRTMKILTEPRFPSGSTRATIGMKNRIRELLETVSVDDLVAALRTSAPNMIQHVEKGFLSELPYMMDFADHEWFNFLSNREMTRAALYLFKSVLSSPYGFDTLELYHRGDWSGSIHYPDYWMYGAKLARGSIENKYQWMNTTGYLLQSIWLENKDMPEKFAVLSSCFGEKFSEFPISGDVEQLFDQFQSVNSTISASIISIYRCLATRIVSEQLAIPESDFDRIIALVLHLFRLVSSAQAYRSGAPYVTTTLGEVLAHEEEVEAAEWDEIERFPDTEAESLFVSRRDSSFAWFSGFHRGDGTGEILSSFEGILGGRPECNHLIDYMNDRPDWFVFSRASIGALRSCSRQIVDAVGDIPIEGRNFFEFMRLLIRMIYGKAIERILREDLRPAGTRGPMPTQFRMRLLLALGEAEGGVDNSTELVIVDPAVRERLIAAVGGSDPVDIETILSFVTTDKERRYLEVLSAANFNHPAMFSFGDSADHIWNDLIGDDVPVEAIFNLVRIFKSLGTFDDTELVHMADLGDISYDSAWKIRARIHSKVRSEDEGFADWMKTTGQLLFDVLEGTRGSPASMAAFYACFTERFYELIKYDIPSLDITHKDEMKHVHWFFGVLSRTDAVWSYQCFVDGILSGAFPLSDGVQSVARLLYMMRLASHPAGFLKLV